GTVGEEFLAVLNQGAAVLIADMSTTRFCDSSGVSAMVRVFKQAAASGRGMRLVISTPAVRRVLSIAGFNRLVDGFPSVAASLADASGQPQPDSAIAGADTDGA